MKLLFAAEQKRTNRETPDLVYVANYRKSKLERKRMLLIFKNERSKRAKWRQELADYIRQHFHDFYYFVRINYRSDKLEYCILFSELNLLGKDFRIEDDKIIFKIEHEDLNKLRDTRRVKILKTTPNWIEKRGFFYFLWMETDCHFKEMPKLLELGHEEFNFKTTCKEIISLICII